MYPKSPLDNAYIGHLMNSGHPIDMRSDNNTQILGERHWWIEYLNSIASTPSDIYQVEGYRLRARRAICPL